MSSPNPFDMHASALRTQLSPQDSPPFMPVYPSVAPLRSVVYRRGRASFRLNPYSREHASLTGHSGTPSFRGGSLRDGGSRRDSENHDSLTISSTKAERKKTPDALPRLLSSPGDTPASAPATGIRGAQSMIKEERLGSEVIKALKLEQGPLALETYQVKGEENADDYALSHSPALRSTVTPKDEDVVDNGGGDSGSDTESDAEEMANEDEPQRDTSLLENASSPARFVTEPVEWGHRRSPYGLRPRGRQALKQVIGRHAQAHALPFDQFVLRKAGVKAYNPSIHIPTPTELLHDCGSALGTGITIPQFGRVFKRCMDCDHFFLGFRFHHGHDCHGVVADVNAANFRFTDYLWKENCRGLTEENFEELLTVCDTCFRVCLTKHADWHACPSNKDPDYAA